VQAVMEAGSPLLVRWRLLCRPVVPLISNMISLVRSWVGLLATRAQSYPYALSVAGVFVISDGVVPLVAKGCSAFREALVSRIR